MSTAFILMELGFPCETQLRDGVNWLFENKGSSILAPFNVVINNYDWVEKFPEFRILTFNESPIDPLSLINSNKTNLLDRFIFHSSTPIITPFHTTFSAISNIAKESSSAVAELKKDIVNNPDLVLRIGDLNNSALVSSKLKAIQEHKQRKCRLLVRGGKINRNAPEVRQQYKTIYSESKVISNCLQGYNTFKNQIHCPQDFAPYLDDNIIFINPEGALKDSPITFWKPKTIGFAPASKFLQSIGFNGEIKRIGLIRSLMVRRNGHLPSSSAELNEFIENDSKCGYLDTIMLKAAQESIGEMDGFLITDHGNFSKKTAWPVCFGYKNPNYSGLFYWNKTLPIEQQKELFNTSSADTTIVNRQGIIQLISSIFKAPLLT